MPLNHTLCTESLLIIQATGERLTLGVEQTYSTWSKSSWQHAVSGGQARQTHPHAEVRPDSWQM